MLCRCQRHLCGEAGDQALARKYREPRSPSLPGIEQREPGLSKEKGCVCTSGQEQCDFCGKEEQGRWADEAKCCAAAQGPSVDPLRDS